MGWDHFNCKITNVIDAIAPTKVKAVSGKKRSPWRNVLLLRTEKRVVREKLISPVFRVFRITDGDQILEMGFSKAKEGF